MHLSIQIIRNILAFLVKGKSVRTIASETGVSKSVVNKLAVRIRSIEWPIEELLTHSDSELEQKLYPRKDKVRGLERIDWAEVCQWLTNKHVNLQLAYQEIKANHPDIKLSYPHFCRKYRTWVKGNRKQAVTANVPYIAAEKMEIDYSGDLLNWVDEQGEIHKAHIFVACFPYSGYLFAYATKDEKAESWIEGTVQALNFASGSPKILVVDNARALVSKASKEEGTVTSLVQDLCDHYGMTPWSCKPYSPKEKNRVEASVKLVQTWLQGALELQGLVCARDLDELNEKLKIRVSEINRKPLSDPAQKTCREKKFLEEEFPSLTPLPDTEYEVCKWLALTVDKSHCVKIHCDNGHRYSVPAAYLHKIVHVRLTKDEVIIFDRDTHEKLGVHLRCYNNRGQKTHILESHLTDLEKNRRREPQYFIDTFVRKGVPEEVARRYVEQSWQKSGDFVCRQRLHAITHNLLNVGDKRSELLTEALSDAIEFNQFSYKFLKELLEMKVEISRCQTKFKFDLQSVEDEEYCTPNHENVRKYE